MDNSSILPQTQHTKVDRSLSKKRDSSYNSRHGFNQIIAEPRKAPVSFKSIYSSKGKSKSIEFNKMIIATTFNE